MTPLWNGLFRPATSLDQRGPDRRGAPTACTMEPGAVNRIKRVERRKGAAVLSRSDEFEEFARDCVRLAAQADTPELREKLLHLAGEWMRAVMPENRRIVLSSGAPRGRREP